MTIMLIIKRKWVLNMKKFSIILLLIAILFCTLDKTLAYYNTNSTLTNSFVTKKYNLKINGNGGTFSNNTITIKNNSLILPTPQRLGYEFLGYVGIIPFSSSIAGYSRVSFIYSIAILIFV